MVPSKFAFDGRGSVWLVPLFLSQFLQKCGVECGLCMGLVLEDLDENVLGKLPSLGFSSTLPPICFTLEASFVPNSLSS